MNLITTIEALQKRPVTAEETAHLHEFQRHFAIDDDDPLIVVLAMMARSQNILDAVPKLLQQKVSETIEMHQQVLRKQAIIVSQELISDVANLIREASQPLKRMWLWYTGFFVGGIFTSALLFVVALQFVKH